MARCHEDEVRRDAHGATSTTTAAPVRVALIGSPNAGKTTLFNAITGARAKTANYGGVTVICREAPVMIDARPIDIIDLPGTYSLTPMSPDEQVVADLLAGRIPGADMPDALVVVADATSIERSLLLVAEALLLDKPTCLVLTMLDELRARAGDIDFERLQAALGIPVVGVVAHRGIGVDRLRSILADSGDWPRPIMAPSRDDGERAAWVSSIIAASVTHRPGRHAVTERVDRVVLHPLWGTLLFAIVMVVFFQIIFVVAAPLQKAVGNVFDALPRWVETLLPGALGALIGGGVIAGVGTVVQFLPQIMLLFFAISFLENIGYMARAAFVVDRVMGRFGLEGRCFISMLSSFACAVPGIMSTRTIPSSRNRIATIMAAPLMTCSARLPVFTLLIAAFVPNTPVLGPLRSQGLVLLGLYLLGASSGLVVAAALKATALRDTTVPFYMELPPYRLPTRRLVLMQVWDSARAFLHKAGTIIFGAAVVLWILLNVPAVQVPAGMTDSQATSYKMEHSIAGTIGHAAEPVFRPLGFDWRINVALIGSLSAREVFVSTLAETSASTDESKLPDTLRDMTNRTTGEKTFSPPTVAALLVFFVFALQCMSTIAVMRRETNSWRWPVSAFTSMFVVAYIGALIAHATTAALTG